MVFTRPDSVIQPSAVNLPQVVDLKTPKMQFAFPMMNDSDKLFHYAKHIIETGEENIQPHIDWSYDYGLYPKLDSFSPTGKEDLNNSHISKCMLVVGVLLYMELHKIIEFALGHFSSKSISHDA